VTWPATLEINDFLGGWHLSRVIDDRHAGQRGTLEGAAEITRDGSRYLYREQGTLSLGGQVMQAARQYLWLPLPGGVDVRFEDGRRFHRIDLSGATTGDTHACSPDMYRVNYDFAGWPEWRALWRVGGPRKDYEMVTVYRR